MKVLDLFSGIGGFSLGLEKAGMQTVAFCEIEPFARDVIKKHWPKVPLAKDVRELHVDPRDFFLCGNDGAVTDQDIDLISGGFPCQDISGAGSQKGFLDEYGNPTRSGLWYQFKRLIEEIRPKYAIIENVAKLRSNGLVEILQGLSEIGYDSEWEVIPATAVGLPSTRERIWIVAYASSQRRNVLEDHTQGRNIFRYVYRYATENETEFPKEELELWSRENGPVHRRLTTSFWESKSRILGMVDGLSKEMVGENDKRIKALGNTIVPKIAELIGKAIMEEENKNDE